jgi:S-methylmethionine-dependent homocysteine/selenocysteine methylase
MPAYRDRLPQLSADVFLTDGGIETTLIFDEGLDLPDFAAFSLLSTPDGRAALDRYFAAYASIARRDGVGIVLETATWRANRDWAARQGVEGPALTQVNQQAVDQLVAIREQFQTDQAPIVISGCIGPRGDGYVVGAEMTPHEASKYHSLQAQAFAASEADLVSALTMTYPAEAIGVVEAARAAGMPVVISFTVETDGTLPSGMPLGRAIEEVDRATGAYAAYYMVNCAHPDHFGPALEPGAPWTARLGGIRANASRMSHAELDAAEELDAGDPHELAALYRKLRDQHPNLKVLGGCCGTSDLHVQAISSACAKAAG